LGSIVILGRAMLCRYAMIEALSAPLLILVPSSVENSCNNPVSNTGGILGLVLSSSSSSRSMGWLLPVMVVLASNLTSRSQKVCVFSDLFRPRITKVSELNTMLFNNYIKICVRYYRNVYKRSRILISR
jgi:hypothetical protein